MIILLITGCSSIVAKADGIEIAQKEVDRYINFLKNQEDGAEVPETEDELKQLEINIIDSLIVLKLVEKYAEENNIAVTEGELDRELDLIIETYPSEQEFDEDLKSKGIDRDFLIEELKGQLLRERIYLMETLDAIVSAAQVTEYYEENMDTLFKVPEKIKVSHILAIFPWMENDVEETEKGKNETFDKIKDIMEKIGNGEDFETLAMEYSDDTATGENGGDLGYISKGQMVLEFEDAAFALEVDDISGIIETVYGYHIIKAVDFQKEYIKNIEEVEETINEYLLNQVKATKWEDFILSLIEAANIEYLTDRNGTLNDEDLGAPLEDDVDTSGAGTDETGTE